MPLSEQDCIDLIREIQGLLREFDPGVLGLVLEATEMYNDPRRYLVSILGSIRRIYTERSGGMHGPILDRLNRFVRLPDGSPVQGLSVALSPIEQDMYRTDEVNLAELPDRSDFLADLDRIIKQIVIETGLQGNWQ